VQSSIGDVFIFVSHSTYVLQSLTEKFSDNSKTTSKKCRVDLSNKNTDTVEYEFFKAAKKTLYIVLYEDTIKDIFKKAGIWSKNKEHILNHPVVGPSIAENQSKETYTTVKIDNTVLIETKMIEELERLKSKKTKESK
jgi:hypothetical protein